MEGTGTDVYVQLPEGLVNNADDGRPPVWKLKRTLYGLRRSPAAFRNELCKLLMEKGYTKSKFDECLYYKLTEHGEKIFFCTHVDDFAIAASNPTLIDDLCKILRGKYIITESDSLESFLGVHMIRENGSLYLSQPGKIAKLVEAAGLPTTAHTYQNPMRETFSDDDQDKSPQCDHTLYKSLLGGLIFVLRSRPDIAYAVNRLATRSTKATEKDMEASPQASRCLSQMHSAL